MSVDYYEAAKRTILEANPRPGYASDTFDTSGTGAQIALPTDLAAGTYRLRAATRSPQGNRSNDATLLVAPQKLLFVVHGTTLPPPPWAEVQPTGSVPRSPTACSDTPIWQFPIFPNVPEYCRFTPGEPVPCFANPVSSSTHASTAISGVTRSAHERTTSAGSHGESARNCCIDSYRAGEHVRHCLIDQKRMELSELERLPTTLAT
jgi:hypothetical protein